MTGTDIQLLKEQLTAARRELAHGGGEPLEVAALAGQLQRIAPDDADLQGLTLEVERASLARAVEQVVEQVLEVDEGDEPEESWDTLTAFDAICAAAAWLGAIELVKDAVSDAVNVIRAFPRIWSPHAAAASHVLQSCPPRPGDPAGRLWAAIEATPWIRDEDDPDAEVPMDLRVSLGLGAVVSLAPFVDASERLAAADGLPEEAPWRRLAHGTGWELALTIGDHDEPVLLLSGAPGATFEHEGAQIEPTPSVEGLSCPASPGVWRVDVEGRELRFEVAR